MGICFSIKRTKYVVESNSEDKKAGLKEETADPKTKGSYREEETIDPVVQKLKENDPTLTILR